MREEHRVRAGRIIFFITILFVLIAGTGLFLGDSYINKRLLQANENNAIDIAQLVKNNFHITDAEVDYMKSLTFNEMEVDKINNRLMDIGNGVKLNADIINVFVVAPLKESEIKYTVGEDTSEFFGYDVGTRLNGIWLLNGNINDEGKFEAKKRDDIYRYTLLTDNQEKAIKSKEILGELSEDAWGKFITGYSPLFTVEGNFVGLLGIDMSPDKYQDDAQRMIFILIATFVAVFLAVVGLFLYFYVKYIKAKEGQLYFDFYSRMSHDMRTPMNGILGMVALSKDETDADVLRNNFVQVGEAGRYMLGLINDTLDVQKLDAGRLHLDPKIRNCHEMIYGIVNMIKLEAQKKNINIECINKGIDVDSYGYVDELRIQQIFMNIASNAIKFTPAGGKITVTAERLSVENNVCHDKFQITDTGIGMSKEFIEKKLFKPFEQEQNSVTTQYGGSGLGLSIVKSLVELMNGKIEVESTIGKGTTFTVYLAFQKVDKEKAEKEIHNQEQKDSGSLDLLQGKRILLCEDNALNSKIAARLLERYGCSVEIAENGKIGVDRFEKSAINYYDVILMDIRMPQMDGLTATRKIRSLQRADAKAIPIIAMTANVYDEDKKHCKEAGMEACIAKPIDTNKMYNTIAKFL